MRRSSRRGQNQNRRTKIDENAYGNTRRSTSIAHHHLRNAHSHSTLPALLLACLFPYPPYAVLHRLTRRFKQSQNLDIKDTPSLINSPSSISISLRRWMTNISPMLYFRRGRGCSSKAISHVSGVPWPRPPRHSPSPPSPEIRPPSDLGRCASIISELDMACTNSLASPSFSRPSEMFPSTHIILSSARIPFQRPHTHPHSFTPRLSQRTYLYRYHPSAS
ncbi:hypothetical protein EDB89DRAFT_584137 [Lactarius sanguifluus]|nr:hypothetical protein EDB89DRAFT_584137 [Lactarius sanguifluus]